MARGRKALPPVEELDDGFTGDNGAPSALMDEVERLKPIGEVDLLKEARAATIRLLLAKLNTGEISAAELAVLRNLLRDNGMVIVPMEQEEDPEPNKMGFHLPDLSAGDEED